MISEVRMKRAHWRAHHRGTKEADMLVGGFADRWMAELAADEVGFGWFEALMEEQDVDIMAWAMKVQEIPARWQGPMMERLCRLDFVKIEE